MLGLNFFLLLIFSSIETYKSGKNSIPIGPLSQFSLVLASKWTIFKRKWRPREGKEAPQCHRAMMGCECESVQLCLWHFSCLSV